MPEVDRNQLIASIVPDYTGWLRKLATGMLSPGHEALDDLVQEGFIAMWRAVLSLDLDAAPADYWLKRSAHQRMLTVVARGMKWTGSPDRRNGGHESVIGAPRPLSLSEASSHPDLDFEPEDVSIAAAFEQALWAYHEGEMAQLLAGLDARTRDYLVKRFWHGWLESELDGHFQVTSRNIWRKAKPQLKEILAHLR